MQKYKTILTFYRVTRLLPEVSADVGGEETVDDRICGGVEWCQTLDQRGYGYVRLRLGYVSVDLEQVKHYVGAPAQDEHCNNNNISTNLTPQTKSDK